MVETNINSKDHSQEENKNDEANENRGSSILVTCKPASLSIEERKQKEKAIEIADLNPIDQEKIKVTLKCAQHNQT